MNFSEDILQHIEDYLNGDLNAEETKAFENQIKKNLDLAEAIKVNKKMRLQYGENDWDFIKDDKTNKEQNDLESLLKSDEFQDKKKAIQNASDLYFNKKEVKNSNNNKSKLYYILAIAAAIIVFLGVFLKDNSVSCQEIYSDYSNWNELPSLISRSEANAVLLSTGENAFINKDYKLASESFNSYINNETELNVTASLYLGISQLETNDFNAALKSFQKVIDSKSLDQSKGYWYKALAYLKIEDKDNAIKELQIIVSNTSNYKYIEAKAILDQLN